MRDKSTVVQVWELQLARSCAEGRCTHIHAIYVLLGAVYGYFRPRGYTAAVEMSVLWWYLGPLSALWFKLKTQRTHCFHGADAGKPSLLHPWKTSSGFVLSSLQMRQTTEYKTLIQLPQSLVPAGSQHWARACMGLRAIKTAT